MRLVLRAAICVVALLSGAAMLHAADAASTPSFAPKPAKSSTETAPPAEIQALLNLLADPKVQVWLTQQKKSDALAAETNKPALESPQQIMSSHVDAVREHIAGMVDVMPDMPEQFIHAAEVFRAKLGDRRPERILGLVATFAALGFGAEWLFWLATKRLRRHLETHPVETVGDRVRLVAERAAIALGLVVAFALGSIGAFLAFKWPSLLRQIVLGYLIVFLAIRIAAVLGRFLLAPYNERLRVCPMEAEAARFWYVRLKLVVGWLALGLVTKGVLGALEVSPPARDIVGYGFGLGTLVILLEAIWRRPFENVGAEPGTDDERRHLSRVKLNALLTAGIILLYALRVAGTMPAFWLLLVALVWPLADRLSRRGVEHILRPPGTTEAAGVPTLTTVFLERGLRAALIIAALILLAWGWGIDIESLTANETMMTRFARGALSAVAIALIADFFWHVAKAAIDAKLAETADPGVATTPEARRRARLRTLLPIFRNMLFVVVVVVAAMMALSALGVEIGPLIAGASVIGVAIGFGAQTFVRDVIAGMFYLLDDAFRVGEYIQSGNYKGTVEGFSIRSVRLRHQRGPIFTVPFGLLGAVENMSRDWVIDKITLGVTYDTDLDLARKLIKQVGLELAEEPDFAPMILQPLKMQGVDAFGDFAIQLRAKMMTLPGEQFMIRRAAYARIKKAFDANGIKFAFPTVQVAGDKDPAIAAAAAAKEALMLTRPQAAE
ncbi:MAG: mechanosensitive ion channel family protein [Stellaceae bacterium]